MTDFPAQVDRLPKAPDLLVIGGGIAGLWCAERAMRAGLTTVLIEKRTIGAGASGGYLGALMPHQPVNWNAKKQFQLDGLLSLEDEIATLEAATGLSCGYRRSGRIMPLRDAGQRQRALGRGREVAKVWPKTSPTGAPLSWTVDDGNPAPGWLAGGAGSHGVSLDTLSARVAPRRLVAALAARLSSSVTIVEHCAVAAIEAGGAARLADGSRITPAKTIIAAGYESSSLAGAFGASPVSGVKGQAALLRPVVPVAADRPILYDDGVYVIAHDDGMVAVGSTSEKQWKEAGATDERLDALMERAAALCPALDGATVIGRWAGIRPRGATPDPIVTPLPDAPDVILCTAGYKISFGIAHKMADQAMGFL